MELVVRRLWTASGRSFFLANSRGGRRLPAGAAVHAARIVAQAGVHFYR